MSDHPRWSPPGLDRTRRASALMVLAALLTLTTQSAAATPDKVGAAIDLGRIDVDEPLVTGQRYVLPTLQVRNPGSIATNYRMVAQAIARTTPALDGAWVSFTPDSFTLEPGERQPVEAVLVAARDAEPGQYRALLGVQAIPARQATQVVATTGAASYLTFSLEAAPAVGVPWWIVVFLVLPPLAALVSSARRRRARQPQEAQA
jgi:hypothetical protein